KKRLRDIGEARIALDTLGSEPEAHAAAIPAPPPRKSRSTAIAWGVAALSLVVAAVATIGGSRRADSHPAVVRFEVGPPANMLSMNWPRISPDGTMLAFQGRGQSGKSGIWVRRLDSFEAQELPGTELAARPWWSPDSRFVACFVGGQLKKFPVNGAP